MVCYLNFNKCGKNLILPGKQENHNWKVVNFIKKIWRRFDEQVSSLSILQINQIQLDSKINNSFLYISYTYKWVVPAIIQNVQILCHIISKLTTFTFG